MPPRPSDCLTRFVRVTACCLLLLLSVVASDLAAPAIRVVRNVPVPIGDGAHVTLDVWRAPRVRPRARPSRDAAAKPGSHATKPAAKPVPRLRPVALLVHGGGWHSGDKLQWEQSGWAQRLARRGWLVVNANYRLSCTTPTVDVAAAARVRDAQLCGHAMRTSVGDVRAALRFTAVRARAWGGDPDRIVVFGASAGSQLAMLATSARDRPRGVRAVIAIGPPTDLGWIGARPQLPIYPSARQSIGCALDECDAMWRTVSPITRVRRGVTPPTWTFVAGSDPITPIEPVRAYVARLRAARISAALVTTADLHEQCHGPIPCAKVRLAGSRLDLFQIVQAWLRPRLG